ncbi:MAG: hypothetical protein JWN03_6131 [Nocardia sp.]|nr:hypothetical protein [Nocardia sp.]
MIDTDLMRRIRAFPADDCCIAGIDPIIVLVASDDDSELRGGTIADLDRIRAAELVAGTRSRARWRPQLTNRAINDHFSAPQATPMSNLPAPKSTAVRMPRYAQQGFAEVALFWVTMQLLGEWQVPSTSTKTATSKEVRAACGAAAHARVNNVDADLIEESLSDVAALCSALLLRRDAIASNAPDMIGRHDAAVRAVALLATGLPSAARLTIEGIP